MDCDKGSLVVLGFGLLLCECWRAVEVEEDDEHSPDFLRESLLGKKRADKVIMAIQKIFIQGGMNSMRRWICFKAIPS